jgi:hypothetical protein
MASTAIDRLDGLSSSAAIKGPVRVATTANITLYGEQTIDGVAVVDGDRVLVKDQTAGYENGIYVVNTGQWRRSRDFNRTRDVVKGTMIFVNEGTANSETMWAVSADDPVDVGTDAITFSDDVLFPPNDSVGNGQLQDGAITFPKFNQTQAALASVYAGLTAKLEDSSAVYRTLAARTLNIRSFDVEEFGAVSYTQAQLEALDGAGSVTTVAASNTTAFQNALDYLEENGGGFLLCRGQIYVLGTTGLRVGASVYICGSGNGEWEPVFPGRPKTWTGTTFLFKGTGSTSVTFAGITSMKYAGGWRENPSAPGTYFKIMSAYEGNASGTSPAAQRQFSAAIKNKTDALYWGVSNLRVTQWSGQNGIEGHSDQASTSLGDDWDFGILLDNTEYANIFDVQSVGDWREAAFCMLTTAISNSRSERNSIRRCKFQGRVGTMIRAADKWDVDATTASSVQIYFSEESYWASTGTFRGSDDVTYTYTGTSKVGTAFTFTGVTPNPTGIFQVRHPSTGFGNCEFEDVYSYGLDHVSGDLAPALGLADSKALEISGQPIRGIEFRNFKGHTSEAVVFQLHDCQDIVFFKPQWEGGGHLIASPSTTAASYAAAPMGDTRGLVMIADQGTADQTRTLFLPRDPYIQSLMNKLRSDLSGNYTIKPLLSGQQFVLQDGAGTEAFRTSGTAIRLGQTATDSPGGGNTTAGAAITMAGRGSFSVSGDYALNVNRNTDDGVVVNIRQDGAIEGSITITGTTTAYNTFCGAHWSQLEDSSTPEILRGTVLETIDLMCEWYLAEFTVITPEIIDYDDNGNVVVIQTYNEERMRIPYYGDEPAGATAEIEHEGETYAALIVQERNDQLPRFKISEEQASKSVYGVFMTWDGDGDAQIASLGAYVVRISAGETINRGDYLESAGNGCARVQSDDILRSSTIGKVTSAEVVETYEDGSFLVPCTLHCG